MLEEWYISNGGDLIEMYVGLCVEPAEGTLIPQNVMRKMRDIPENWIVFSEEMQKIVKKVNFSRKLFSSIFK